MLLKASVGPSDFFAFDFKEEFARFGICAVSAPIAINWPISDVSDGLLATNCVVKNTVSRL
jgi:hypothetical protein